MPPPEETGEFTLEKYTEKVEALYNAWRRAQEAALHDISKNPQVQPAYAELVQYVAEHIARLPEEQRRDALHVYKTDSTGLGMIDEEYVKFLEDVALELAARETR